MSIKILFIYLFQILAPVICIFVPIAIDNAIENEMISAAAASGTVWYHLISGSATLYFVKPYGDAMVGYRKRFLDVFRSTVRNQSIDVRKSLNGEMKRVSNASRY